MCNFYFLVEKVLLIPTIKLKKCTLNLFNSRIRDLHDYPCKQSKRKLELVFVHLYYHKPPLRCLCNHFFHNLPSFLSCPELFLKQRLFWCERQMCYHRSPHASKCECTISKLSLLEVNQVDHDQSKFTNVTQALHNIQSHPCTQSNSATFQHRYFTRSSSMLTSSQHEHNLYVLISRLLLNWVEAVVLFT